MRLRPSLQDTVLDDGPSVHLQRGSPELRRETEIAGTGAPEAAVVAEPQAVFQSRSHLHDDI